VAFVVDASVAMAWCFEDEQNPYTESVLDRLSTEAAVAPPIWACELVNVLLVAERKGRISAALADEFLYTLGELPITVTEFNWPSQAETLLLRGRATGLSAYDTDYLALALRLAYPLATQDKKLRAAALELGVAILS
jgi:predicted nucleic acid-binding protein